ncbi:MAG TPA: LysM peptidoglycan-binding domain-containing protein [Chthoniobacterales bacterium]
MKIFLFLRSSTALRFLPVSAYVACMKPWLPKRLAFLVILAACPVSIYAQDAAQTPPNSDVRRDLAALREAVIQQTRQIDALTAEVARLNRIVSGSKSTASSAPTATLPAPKALPATAQAQEAGVTNPQESPVAETPTGPEHEIQKGESLSSIAKKYGTTVDVLAKLNHISDPRKILAGQKLKLPPTAVATPAAASPAAVSPLPSATP